MPNNLELRKLIQEAISGLVNEGTIGDFKYDAVKSAIQNAINNSSISLEDISPHKYFIVCFGLFNNHISTMSTTIHSEAVKLLSYYKTDENIWKIYVEKPLVAAKVFMRNEQGWKEVLDKIK